ncbi:MAG TPA: hypothetical protein VKR61_17385 [Bryobacteraceae bacterium]|nr:hypothetical protein [Bryobacteraceae bacterium]
MKTKLFSAPILAITALSFTGLALAQEDVDTTPGRPRYVTLPPKPSTDLVTPASSLPTWTGSFTYGGNTYNYTMVGTAPSTGTSTSIPVVIIPVKVVITSRTGTKTTFDPTSIVSSTTSSPIFDNTTTYTQGGVDVGTTQYIDAFQRANFWGTVSTQPNYHLLLGPVSQVAEVTFSPTSRQGTLGKPFGFVVGEVGINWFDVQVRSQITKLGITPGTLPIFLTRDVYLTSGGCCVGGYHSATGAQSYAYATYIDHVGAFAQDVSALSHEVGEWADDPLVTNSGNPVPCSSNPILEVGDPLEGNANYGGYPYVLHGFTYNLQDLVTLPYFGAPASTSVNGWFTFQGETLSVCQNGG